MRIIISNQSELPIYAQIKEQLKEQILNGQIPEGSTLPSIRQLAKEMKTGLERQGFTVDIANTGLEGEEKASITDYDAVLLDLNLPDRDGLDILAFLRNSGRNMPVLIVSAREAVKERAAGLDLGADDYIVKPFDFIELTSRIRAVVRRFYGRTSPRITICLLYTSPSPRDR